MTSDPTETKAEAKRKRKSTMLERLLMFGFVVVVLVAGAMYLSGARAVDKAAKQLDRRSIVVTYLNDDNVWDNCNDIKNREFFLAVSHVINASVEGNDAEVLEASRELAAIEADLSNIEDPSVCGPPPIPPADPDEQEN